MDLSNIPIKIDLLQFKVKHFDEFCKIVLSVLDNIIVKFYSNVSYISRPKANAVFKQLSKFFTTNGHQKIDLAALEGFNFFESDADRYVENGDDTDKTTYMITHRFAIDQTCCK